MGMRLAISHVKEAVRVLLHTILLNRAIGGQTAVEPRTIWSDGLDLAYMRLDDTEIAELVESRTREFCGIFEKNTQKTTGCVTLNFYTTKTKKPSVWNILLGQEEKIVF